MHSDDALRTMRLRFALDGSPTRRERPGCGYISELPMIAATARFTPLRLRSQVYARAPASSSWLGHWCGCVTCDSARIQGVVDVNLIGTDSIA
jgi:hypothetical protein